MDLSSKVAIVTGASSGIGEAIARNLSAAGCRVVLTARREERLVALQQQLPNESAILVADVAAPDTGDKLLALALERFGRADILINNAGLLAVRPIDQVDFDVISKVIAINLESVIRLSYIFAKHFKAQKAGAIVNVSSIGAFMTIPTGGVYSAVKAGVESFTAALRVELAGSGVRVGTIAPGSTESEIIESAKESGEQPWEQQVIPLKADDVAEAVKFMLIQPPQSNIARMHIYSSEEFV